MLGSAASGATSTVNVDNGLAGLFTPKNQGSTSVEMGDMKIFVRRNKVFLRFDTIKQIPHHPCHLLKRLLERKMMTKISWTIRCCLEGFPFCHIQMNVKNIRTNISRVRDKNYGSAGHYG